MLDTVVALLAADWINPAVEIELVFPTNNLPLASSIIAWVKVIAVPAVPEAA